MIKTISLKFYLRLIEKNLSSSFLSLPITPESFVSLNIFNESLSYSLKAESPKMDCFSLLGNIGGNLSLILEVSFFNICEFVKVIINMIFIKKRNLAYKL